MNATEPRLDREVIARLGQEAYERIVQPLLKDEDKGKFVVVNAETGAFELDADSHIAVRRLYARVPDAQPWLVRVGYAATHKIRRIGNNTSGHVAV
jgi:hypothetical protein